MWKWLAKPPSFILSSVFCGSSQSLTATTPLLSSFSLTHRSAWYSGDCVLFLPLQPTLMLSSYFLPLFSLHLFTFLLLFVGPSLFLAALRRLFVLFSSTYSCPLFFLLLFLCALNIPVLFPVLLSMTKHWSLVVILRCRSHMHAAYSVVEYYKSTASIFCSICSTYH